MLAEVFDIQQPPPADQHPQIPPNLHNPTINNIISFETNYYRVTIVFASLNSHSYNMQ